MVSKVAFFQVFFLPILPKMNERLGQGTKEGSIAA